MSVKLYQRGESDISLVHVAFPKKDHIKNEDIWREANIKPMSTFLRKRLGWYANVLGEEGDTTKKMLNMQVQEKRRRGGPRRDT